MIVFVLALALSAPAAVAPASRPAITKETRPDLFADEPPARSPGTASAPAGDQPRETTLGFWLSMLFRTVLVLGAVVLLAYLILNKGLTRLMKLTGVNQGKNLVLIERLALDQKHALFLVEVEGRRLIVGTGEHTTHLVADLSKDQKGDLAPLSAMTADKGTGG